MEMRTYSRLYDLFCWIRINSYAGLVLFGILISIPMKLVLRVKYNTIIKDYQEYLTRADVETPAGCQYANLASHLIYGTTVKEFFMYDFIRLNDRGRREYITEVNRYRLYGLFNGEKKRVEMENKYLAYQAFKPYYRREAMYIGTDTGFDEVMEFFSERDSAILKPNMAGVGKGVEMVKVSDFVSKEDAVTYILSRKNYILEELVVQSGMMRELHPQSLNTVRIYACRLRNGVRIFGSHLRAGRGDSVVDNAGQGGVIVSITNDGVAWTSGMDEFGHTFITHPETGFYIPGIKMPEWEQAVRLVEQAMSVYPDIRFVGWDLAYTEKGWIIIEANENGQFHGAQIPHHKGFRNEFLRMAEKL